MNSAKNKATASKEYEAHLTNKQPQNKIRLGNAYPSSFVFIILIILAVYYEAYLESSFNHRVDVQLLSNNKESKEIEMSEISKFEEPIIRQVGGVIYQTVMSASAFNRNKISLLNRLPSDQQLKSMLFAIKKLKNEKHYRKALNIVNSLSKIELMKNDLLFYKASLLSKIGDKEEAVEHYEKFISVSPLSQAGLINLGLLYLEQKEFNKAEVIFKKAIKLTSSDKKAKSYSGLGESLYQQKKYDIALKNFKKSIEYRPKSVLTWRNIAKTSQKLGEHLLTIDAFTKAVSLEKNNFRTRVEYANYLISRMDYLPAIQQLNTAKSIKNSNFDVRLKLSFSYMMLNKYINAKKQLDFAKKNIQKKSERRLSDAVLKLLSNNHTESIKLFKKNIKRKKIEGLAFLMLALNYDKLKRPKTALKYLLQVKPDFLYYLQSQQKIADIYIELKRFNDAVTIYKKLFPFIKENPELLYKASLSEEKANHYNESMRLISLALKIKQKKRWTLQKVKLYWLLEEQDKAILELKALLAKYPRYTRARYFMANYLNKLGELEQSISQYTELLSISSSYGDAQYQLALLYFNNKEIEQAQLLLKDYLYVKADSKRGRTLYARTFCEADQFQQCREELELVLKLDPNYKAALDIYNTLK